MAWHIDGQHIAIAAGSAVHISHATSGERIAIVEFPSTVHWVDFTAKNELVAVDELGTLSGESLVSDCN